MFTITIVQDVRPTCKLEERRREKSRGETTFVEQPVQVCHDHHMIKMMIDDDDSYGDDDDLYSAETPSFNTWFERLGPPLSSPGSLQQANDQNIYFNYLI